MILKTLSGWAETTLRVQVSSGQKNPAALLGYASLSRWLVLTK